MYSSEWGARRSCSGLKTGPDPDWNRNRNRTGTGPEPDRNRKTPHRRSKILSRGPQDGSNSQDTPKCFLDASRRPKTSPDLDSKRFLIDLWCVFDWFWTDYWINFSSFFFIASPPLCCFITCVLGAVAGTQLCCASDIARNINSHISECRYRYRYSYRYRYRSL